MYALIEFAGKQYKIEDDCSIKVPRVQGDVGSKISIENILYLEDGQTKTVGKPFITGKKLNGEIISHGRGRKIVVFKFKRRKGYQTKNTHRDEYTVLKFGKLGVQQKQASIKKEDSSDKKKVVAKKGTAKKVVAKPVSKKKPEVKTKYTKKEKE